MEHSTLVREKFSDRVIGHRDLVMLQFATTVDPHEIQVLPQHSIVDSRSRIWNSQGY